MLIKVMPDAASLRVAFWNVENLFEPGTHPAGPSGKPAARGPQTLDELDAKLARLAECIGAFFGGQGPDLLGLSEIHTERIVRSLAEALPEQYRFVFEPALTPGETGLAVLARMSAISEMTKLEVFSPTAMARPRSMIVRCKLARAAEPVLFVVNHWKSRMVAANTGALTPERDREQTAEWLGNWLATSELDTCVIVAGDFNAEPFESPFSEFRLRGTRHFSTATWARATPAYLYNTAWKFLAEPLIAFRVSNVSGPSGAKRRKTRYSGGGRNYITCAKPNSWGGTKGPEPRPKRTHAAKTVVWDQLMVSGRALKNGPVTLIEETVDYHRDRRNSRYNARGVLVPIRWDYQGPGVATGASDHYPVVAEFAIA